MDAAASPTTRALRETSHAEQGTGRATIPALTGLRAVAAVWVVLFHYRGDIDRVLPVPVVLDRVMAAGYLGVDLFFALSGFVLAYTYADQLAHWRPRAAAGFLRNRVARVWPAHIVTLHLDLIQWALAGTLGLSVETDRRTPAAYVQNLTMTHDWFTDRASFNSPAWSISAEWAAYLACPLLLIGLARIRRGTTAALLALATYAVMLSVYLRWEMPNGNVVHGGLLRVAGGFVAGLLLFRVYQVAGPWLGRLALPTVATVLGLIVVVPGSAGVHYWLAPALGLLVLLLARDAGRLGRLLSRRRFVFWGEVSYCLYLTHLLVQPGLHRLLPIHVAASGSWPVQLVWVGAYAAVIALAAVALHLLVEVPARRLLRTRPRGDSRHTTL